MLFKQSFSRLVIELIACFQLLMTHAPVCVVRAQEVTEKSSEKQKQAPHLKEDFSLTTLKVDVKPVARDAEIRDRLDSVLKATEWFNDPKVRVEQGVVFLSGETESDILKKWASDLAGNTQDVVAVANRMTVSSPSIWDFRSTWSSMVALWRDFIRSLPFFAFGLLILAISIGASLVVIRIMERFLSERVRANLLRNVLARGVGAIVFLTGVYIVLRVSGLTQLALTVVGGTGLIGLAVGIAFRDITENFLASIFLSMQRPFDTGDLIEVAEVSGYVQQLNVRTTILMTLEGNLVQVPNAKVYKSNIRNFTTNPSRREDFIITIGYADSINDAQETASKVLREHAAVLQDPEPSVLVDNLGPDSVNLRVYFWINGRDHSWLKVRSSVIRLVKLAFKKQGFMTPDGPRKLIFPSGLTISMQRGEQKEANNKSEIESTPFVPIEPPDAVSTQAEGGLDSEAGAIEQQARKVEPLKEKENLLDSIPRSTLAQQLSKATA